MIQPKQNIYEILKDFEEIIIVGHVKPDGDAVGAALGTALCLERMGKKPKVLLQAYDPKFLVIPGDTMDFQRKNELFEPTGIYFCRLWNDRSFCPRDFAPFQKGRCHHQY